MEALTHAGLGLDYNKLRLDRTAGDWITAGSSLRQQVAAMLEDHAAGVEHVGSSSIVGLMAKPIVDLAVGVSEHHDLGAVRDRLEAAGWIYRGDAGNDGGHVFVLEARPWHRVAHLHVVDHGGTQWHSYLVLRDLLRRSADARDRYEAVKLSLVEDFSGDRTAYTDGKSDIVRVLLRPPG